MSIGKNIKNLRQKKDITQEQLAQYLNITSRAVSQWECDRTCPDISQIPALCHIFQVSADTLLEIDTTKSELAIIECLKSAETALFSGDFVKNVEILSCANQKYPNSFKIMLKLAQGLLSVVVREIGGERDNPEIYSLCSRILTDCNDIKIRNEALLTLAQAYNLAGNQEMMKKTASEMPAVHMSYENFMSNNWTGNKGFTESQDYISYLIYHTIDMIFYVTKMKNDEKAYFYSSEQKASLCKLAVSMLESMFPDGDFHYKAQLGTAPCSFLALYYQSENDTEMSLYWLEKKADFAIHFDTYDFETGHTSPILLGYVEGGWINEGSGNHSMWMLEWLQERDEFTSIKQNKRYIDLVERLKVVAK